MFHRRHWPYPDLGSALDRWQGSLVCEADTRRLYIYLLTTLLAEVDLTSLRAQDLASLATHIGSQWPSRNTRNAARSALRGFLCWGCTQEIGHRSLTSDAVIEALPMEPRPRDGQAASPAALPMAALHALLPTLPLRTRALVALQVATGLPVTRLVALQLSDITLAPRGLILHLPVGDRELIGEAISEVRAYVKARLKASKDDGAAPLFEGCAGRAITTNYARKLLSKVAHRAGISGSLRHAVRQQAGGIGGW